MSECWEANGQRKKANRKKEREGERLALGQSENSAAARQALDRYSPLQSALSCQRAPAVSIPHSQAHKAEFLEKRQIKQKEQNHLVPHQSPRRRFHLIFSLAGSVLSITAETQRFKSSVRAAGFQLHYCFSETSILTHKFTKIYVPSLGSRCVAH